MKSKLLKKLRRRFADTHKVERERSLLFGDYHFTLRAFFVLTILYANDDEEE